MDDAVPARTTQPSESRHGKTTEAQPGRMPKQMQQGPEIVIELECVVPRSDERGDPS